jgi:hypothetical protein
MRPSRFSALKGWLRGDGLLRSREEACRAAGIQDPDALVFALALGEAAQALRERRDPSPAGRPAQVACYLAASALETVRTRCPPPVTSPPDSPDAAAEQRAMDLVARGTVAWTLSDPLADQAAKEALAEVDRRIRPFARVLRRFSRSRAVARWRAFTLAVPLVAVLSLIPLFVYARTRPKDLLAGRPYRTSSASSDFDVKTHVWQKGTQLPVFFVTNHEESPWIEYDLGQPTPLRRVLIEDRPDCCRARDVPLVIELSDDQKQWRELGRMTQEFFTWEDQFPVVTGRYLRLRVPRLTVFHLHRVEAYDR